MRSRFPIVEIGIVVVAAALIYILERPQYEARRDDERRSDAVHNLYVYKAAIEKYTAYNNGVYPVSPESVEPYLEGEGMAAGQYPPNPYVGGVLSRKDIRWRQYEIIGASRDDSPKGPNGSQAGRPGSISVSWFIPLGESLATEYGIITFGTEGTPVFVKDPSGAKRIIVVHN